MEEYCWAITQAAGRSRYGPLVFSVLESAFQMVPLVYTTYIFSTISSEMRKIRPILDLPESGLFLKSKRVSINNLKTFKCNHLDVTEIS